MNTQNYAKIKDMKSFKKRALTLVLATVISVGGAFANTYKNNLKALKFENGENGAINISIQTEKPYEKPISLNKRDANTYILILSEVKNLASTPDFSNFTSNITSVHVNTLPYTENGKGYTRIVIKTHGTAPITANSKLYTITHEEQEEILQRERELRERMEETQNRARHVEKRAEDTFDRNQTSNTSSKNKTTTKASVVEKAQTQTPAEIPKVETTTTESDLENYTSSSNTEQMMLIMAILIILSISILLYFRAKNRMTDLAGEKLEIDIEEEEKQSSKAETSKMTVNRVVKTNQPAKAPVINSTVPIKTISKENSNIVDLDELFQETKMQTEEEENAALEDFLNGFSFDEEFAKQEAEETLTFNEELYNSIINNKKIKFSNEDIKRVHQLMSSEINDDTLKNLPDYLVSNPIAKKPSIEKLVENVVTTLSVSNNVSFTKEDINALQKIISVELDNDFVQNLKIDPERTKQMEKEIQTYNKDTRKPAKIKTLNVKKELPDLSKISSKNIDNTKLKEIKPLDYSTNCEVTKLEVDLDVDFSKATDTTKEETPKQKLNESNWETSTLKISEMLPDLNDALLHPEKYKKPEPEKFVADEKVLLDRLTNLSFKPIDDGTQNFEIINTSFDEDTEDFIEEERQKLTPEEVMLELQKLQELENLGVKPNIPKPTSSSNVQSKIAIENQAFTIISSINFDDAKGCHLAKNEKGYIILGFIGEKLFKIKEYPELKSEKIQARLNEQLPDGHLRYLVRIGINKLIVDVSNTEIKYVLDLC